MTGPALIFDDVSVSFGAQSALASVSCTLPGGVVTAILGSTGSGKSTFGRIVNRLVELEPGYRGSGTVHVGDRPTTTIPVLELRRSVGMIFARPTAFPGTIRENVAFGLQGLRLQESERNALVESALRRADLWNEVADRLSLPATALTAGQRQRLCIARALALSPSVLVFDEPTARLHPAEAARVETVATSLSPDLTVLFITPDVAQAGRVAEHVALLDAGRLIEQGPIEEVFTNPQRPATEAYLSRRYR